MLRAAAGHRSREGIAIDKDNRSVDDLTPEDLMPEYDDLFDLDALDRFIQEQMDGESPEEKRTREKAKKDEFINAILAEELARITPRLEGTAETAQDGRP